MQGCPLAVLPLYLCCTDLLETWSGIRVDTMDRIIIKAFTFLGDSSRSISSCNLVNFVADPRCHTIRLISTLCFAAIHFPHVVAWKTETHPYSSFSYATNKKPRVFFCLQFNANFRFVVFFISLKKSRPYRSARHRSSREFSSGFERQAESPERSCSVACFWNVFGRDMSSARRFVFCINHVG